MQDTIPVRAELVEALPVYDPTQRPPQGDPPTGSGRAEGAKKKLFIRTFGCQMNEYDSDKMADILEIGRAHV